MVGTQLIFVKSNGIKLAKTFHHSVVKVSCISQGLGRKEMARSNWVFEENLVKEIFAKLWEEFWEAKEGSCSSLGLASNSRESSPPVGPKGEPEEQPWGTQKERVS